MKNTYLSHQQSMRLVFNNESLFPGVVYAVSLWQEEALQGKGLVSWMGHPPTHTHPKLWYLRNHSQSEEGILMYRMMNL